MKYIIINQKKKHWLNIIINPQLKINVNILLLKSIIIKK